MFKVGQIWYAKEFQGYKLKILNVFEKECKVKFIAPKYNNTIKIAIDTVNKKYILNIYKRSK